MTGRVRAFLLTVFSGVFVSAVAWSARPARVDVQDAELFDGPGRGYHVIEKVPRGLPVTASNISTTGYYKVRTPSGKVGFLAADTLLLEDAPQAKSAPVAPPAPEPTPSASSQEFSYSNSWAWSDTRPGRRLLKARLFGGYGFFNSSDIADQVNADNIRNGMSFGGEVGIFLPYEFALVFRAENLRHRSLGQDRTNIVYQWDITSWPVMVGLESQYTRNSRFSLQFGILGGIGLSTKLVSTASLAAPNTTELGRYAITVLGRATANWHVTKMFFVTAEAGYRYLNTQKITPSVEGNGSEIFMDEQLNFVPVTIDMSGPMFSVGVGVVL